MVLFMLWSCTSTPSGPLEAQLDDLEGDGPLEVLPVEVPDPTPELLVAIATEDARAREVVDAGRGFVVVDVFDGSDDLRADPRGRLRVAERLCGEAAEARAVQLAGELALIAESGQPDPFTCEGAVCTHGATNALDHAGSYAFQAPEGRQVLSVVVRTGPVTASPQEQRRIEAWVDGQLRQLASEPCTATPVVSDGDDGGQGG